MAGKRRNPSRRDWPSYVSMPRPGYYAWTHPITGKVYGLGRDKRKAFLDAIAANQHLSGELGKRNLVDRIAGADDTTVAAWIERYESLLAERDIAAETVKDQTRRLRKVASAWGEMRIEAVTTKHVADFLREYEDAGKSRMAQAMRSLLLDVFRRAQAAGWVRDNPAQPTDAKRVKVTRARLTLDQFKAIYAIAQRDGPSWLPTVMELAIVTGQRREDLRQMGAADVSEGYLWVDQSKGGGENRVAIPLGLRLHAVNWSLSEIIQRCRQTYVLSRHFIHHTKHAGMAKPGDAIRQRTITSEFAAARDKAGLTWPEGKEPASFHEIRSLAARLYTDERSKEFAQVLLGHKSAEMTALYRDVRGAEWVKVPL